MGRISYKLCVLFCCLVVSAYGFGQTINATVGGTVADATGALIPGVTVTATNTGTGIANTSVTNESGAYNFAALQPGTYKVSAELPGFRTEIFTDVQLGGAQQVRLNFTLQVGAATGTSLDVTIAADTVLATSSNSVGTVLPEYKVRDLPTIAGNVFNVVQNLPGVQKDGTGTFGYMAGGRLGDVNATRDGVNVNDGRYENGAWSSVFSSPDMIEEVKVVVAPVDAETSRGSGQVQMVTRSGTNRYTGSAHWSNHNSALDANDWFNNLNGIRPGYDNRNQYGVRVGGPILKNRTFFFADFEGQRDMKRVAAAGLTYTDMAKAGIFRFFPSADNKNASGGAGAAVDINGNPVAPSTATGPLSAIGLFGSCTYQGALVPNCKTYSNDANRPAPLQVAFLKEQFSRMPSPNQFTNNGALTGDGLNTALISFVRRQDGLDQTNGNSDEVDRDQYNARIDHNFNSRQKLSIIGTNEHTWGTATQAGLRAWPNAFDGLAVKRPVLYTIQMTSTLSNSMLNQLRLGKSGTNNWQWGPANRNDAIGVQALALMPTAPCVTAAPAGQTVAPSNCGAGLPYRVGFASGIAPFDVIGGFGQWREGINPRYSAGDDVSWTKAKHAFKGGFEWRRTESNGFNDPNIDPVVTLGAGNFPATLDGTVFPGLSTNNATLAKNILYDLSGSVANINQAFGVLSATQTTLVGKPILQNNRHWNYQNEMSAYFKDDWKVRQDLTLNLGIHWEWYGQPYEHNGLAARVVGDENSFLNVSCTSTPGVDRSSSCTNLAQVQFVGKNSTNPNIGTYINGNNNKSFAPSVGFAWNVPWGGKGKTVIRSGYGMSYSGALRNFITVDGVINTVPGINQISGGTGLTYNPSVYTNMSTVTVNNPFPTGQPNTAPFVTPVTNRGLGITTYKQLNPYTQNWNFEIQREVAKNTTVEVRYVGTKGTKLWSGVDLNALNWLRKDGATQLFTAFNTARAGGESALLNQLLNGVGLTGTCVVNGTTCTGAQVLRTNTTTRGQLANGQFGSFLNSLNTNLQYTGGNSDAGSIIRHAGLPDNYLVPDPQYSAVNINGNNQNSTYHSLNLQVTRRLSHGFANTTTYLFSKAMGDVGTSPDPNNRHLTKTLQAVDHAHQISSNGTYELPFGTDHFLLSKAPGWVQNVVSKWQLGGIMNFISGGPLTLNGAPNTITNQAAYVNVVGAIPSDMGKVDKTKGVTYFSGYSQVTDPTFSQLSPACAASTTACNGLAVGYSNKAIQAPDGQIILANPQPGQVGNLGQATFRGPSTFSFDMNMVKRFRITETKQFEFRVDAVNIFNHPNFSDPSVNINSTTTVFGAINTLRAGTNIGGNGGMRSFVINSRINF